MGFLKSRAQRNAEIIIRSQGGRKIRGRNKTYDMTEAVEEEKEKHDPFHPNKKK